MQLIKLFKNSKYHVQSRIVRPSGCRQRDPGRKTDQKVRFYIEKGLLAPDELVINIIADYVASHKDAKGNIFDGFPRTTVQAEAFDKIMNGNGTPVSVMLSLEVPDEELVKRLLLRGKESGRADDSNESVIRNRIDVYKAQTAVVADYYKPQGKFHAVNGLGTIDEIFDRLCKEIDSLLK